MEPGLKTDDLAQKLADLGCVRDPQDRWDLTLIVARERLVEAVTRLRDDPALRFDQLLDVTGVDYLSYAGWSGPRFAVIYVFKSTVFRHRLRLKVQLEETDATAPTLYALYPIADWSERETWDQYGIGFSGHPNLKRLLNHHEFVGHPLRKDYPCQKRQKLSLNDPMLDQLEARLKARGYEILGSDAVSAGSPLVAEVKS